MLGVSLATFGLRVVVKKNTFAEDLLNIFFLNLIQDFVRLLAFKKILFQKKSNMIYHYKTTIQNLNVTVSINDKVTGEDEVSLTPANYRDIKNKTPWDKLTIYFSMKQTALQDKT